jgi:two-component system, OmpR family, KDP operon response regulator KdpE
MSYRLLVVDDEAPLVLALRPALEAEGYRVDTAATGADAVHAVANDSYDVIILDLGLPDGDGKGVIARLRQWSLTPIVVLSARHQEEEVIAALDLGADDFVHKPFSMGQLTARLRVALRGRTQRIQEMHAFRCGALTIDFADRRVWIEGEELRLTQREYAILLLLARHLGRAVTHKQIIDGVWGANATVDAQTVRVLVSQLRDKIEREPSSPRLLLTEPGIGYRLDDGGA